MTSKNIVKIFATFLFISASLLNAQEKQKTFKAFEFSLGGSLPTTKAFIKKEMHYALGAAYSWDVDVAFIEARFDFIQKFSQPLQNYTIGSIGGNFYFLEDELWSLYAGANFGLGFLKIKGYDAKGGFHLGADMGAVFLKQADVNIDTRVRLQYNTATVNDSHPFLIGFLVGLKF
jgi:hypothetical protein